MFQIDTNPCSTFKELITGVDDKYIDKKESICKIYDARSRFNLLTRPFGFGKTVLIDTLFFLFKRGPKSPMFEGLYVSQSETEFPNHFVIKFDFAALANLKTADDYIDTFFNFYKKRLYEINSSLGVELNRDEKFYWITHHFLSEIASVSNTKKIVILIDNYDVPYLHNLYNNNFEDKNEVLSQFYKALYDCETLIDWCLLVGETKFSLSSKKQEGIPYITDLTYDSLSVNVCGFTQGELKKHFQSELEELADATEQTVEMLLGNLSSWHGDYRFTGHNIKVYRPASINIVLTSKDITTFSCLYPYNHLSKILIPLINKFERYHEKLLLPNTCGYAFTEFNKYNNVNFFALLCQIGIFTLSTVELVDDKTKCYNTYKYYCMIVNREMREIYSRLLKSSNIYNKTDEDEELTN